MSIRFFLCAGIALLAACGPAKQEQALAARRAEQLRPADARLAALYERSCLNCHARADSGAPLTGQPEAWGLRSARGLPALVQSAKQGLGAMPAMGLCADCSDVDLRDLITFMQSPSP
ncbi:c-type cytochrome [Paucibacter sp. B2R-40]|uniref:c-type cytochrome n=1 Tax=Paucibacter sp. B2R-40 TaxID=2893554 RepID=UPI0021E44BB3|nr:c-type cytochrome [Paucibacter sp. B2R-40]MCV2356941.1 c-type cytochrome [Paucibacter sp. B2R-40]